MITPKLHTVLVYHLLVAMTRSSIPSMVDLVIRVLEHEQYEYWYESGLSIPNHRLGILSHAEKWLVCFKEATEYQV